jgi:hypothetical protein
MPDLEEWFANYMAFHNAVKLAEGVASMSRPRLTRQDDIPGKIPSLATTVDFLADFDLAAANVLDRPEYLLFRACYLDGRLPASSIPVESRCNITNLVGAELRRRGVGREYFFTSTDVIALDAAERARLRRISEAASKRMRKRQQQKDRDEEKAA